jgi:hypothetical protein
VVGAGEDKEVSNKSPLFDRKVENAMTIANYVISMQAEINPYLNYRKDNSHR